MQQQAIKITDDLSASDAPAVDASGSNTEQSGSGSTSNSFAIDARVRTVLQSLVRLSGDYLQLSREPECKSEQHISQRQDILPCPLPLFWPLASDGLAEGDIALLHSFLQGAVIGVNALYGAGGVAVRVFSVVQMEALCLWALQIVRFGTRLCRVATSGSPQEALNELVKDRSLEVGDVLKCSAKLRAYAFDLLEASGRVDPLPSLPVDALRVLSKPSNLFVRSDAGLAHFQGVKGTDRAEYMKLVAAQLRSGKVTLRRRIKGGGTVFAVPKKGSQKLREVWHGSQVSAAAVPAPRPPHVATPSGLLRLESTSGSPLRLSKRDGRCLFDQLAAPSWLVEWFGRPSVTVAEMMEFGGLSLQELQLFVGDKVPLRPHHRLHPCSLVWPMGFSWSSYIAQTAMLEVCEDGGLTPDMILSQDDQPPADPSSTFCLATDDVCHFTTKGEHASAKAMAQLDRAFLRRGVLKHGGKDIDGTLNGTCIGVDLCDGRYLSANAEKLWLFLLSIVALGEQEIGRASGRLPLPIVLLRQFCGYPGL